VNRCWPEACLFLLLRLIQPGSCILPFERPTNAFLKIQNTGFNLGEMDFVYNDWDKAVSAVNDDANLERLGTPRRRCFDAGLLS
jgi:hypothetical protein